MDVIDFIIHVVPPEGNEISSSGELNLGYWERASSILNRVEVISSIPDTIRAGVVDILARIKSTGEGLALSAGQKAMVLAISAAKSSIQQLPVAFQQDAHAAVGLLNNTNAKFQAQLGDAYAATNQLGLNPNVRLLENGSRRKQKSRKQKLRKARRSRKN
jgi:hypothetical protein